MCPWWNTALKLIFFEWLWIHQYWLNLCSQEFGQDTGIKCYSMSQVGTITNQLSDFRQTMTKCFVWIMIARDQYPLTIIYIKIVRLFMLICYVPREPLYPCSIGTTLSVTTNRKFSLGVHISSAKFSLCCPCLWSSCFFLHAQAVWLDLAQ